MKLKWEVIGGVLTAIYLAGIALLVYLKRNSLQELELNAIGDFLAGAFGPIAFLWLVLGYIQQGRELKLSSDALRLQADELKNSVEQQAHLVAVGREQIVAQLEAQTQERRRHEQAMEANLVFKPMSTGKQGNLFTHNYEIINIGADVTNVEISVLFPSNTDFVRRFNVLKRGGGEFITFAFEAVQQDYHATMRVFYRTLDGRILGFEMDCFISARDCELAIKHPLTAEDFYQAT